NFDGYQYVVDKKERLESKNPRFDPYRHFNLAIRIGRSEQNYVLKELRRMLVNSSTLETDLWINDMFLGFQPPEDDDEESERQEEPDYTTVDVGNRLFMDKSHVQEVLGKENVKFIGDTSGNAFKLRFPISS